jgi:ATP-dependent Clp protease protease subunit
MHKLIQLLAQNKGRAAPAPKIVAKDGEATIYVYDAIGSYYGVEAAPFVREIAALQDVSTIHLRINSPGGDVFDARSMKVALEQHPAKVVAHIDGLAASAASFLMLAADEIEIADGAFVMIHEPWSMAMGTSTDMRASADLLDQVGTAIGNDYTAKTGKSADEVQAWMKAETWFSAEEAIANGFADRLAEKKAASNSAAAQIFNLAAYRNAPKALTEPAAPPPFAALAADRQRYEARFSLIERSAA